MRLRQLFEKDILAGKLANDRRPAALAKHSSHADLHRVREVHDIRFYIANEPRDEFLEFLALVTEFAAEHGDGQITKLMRIDAASAL